MATGHAFYRLFQVGIDIGVVQNSFWMHPNVVVDDEFQPRQTNALVGNLAEIKCQLRVTHVHHDFDVNWRHRTALDLSDFGVQQAVVDIAGVALRAAHRDQHAVFELFGGISTTHHSRNAQLTRNNGRMASTPAPVGHDGAGTLHYGLPVRVGHVGHQHIARLDLVHVLDVPHNTDWAGTDFLANRAAFCQHGAGALELVAHLGLAFGLTFHRFWPGLQNIKQAIRAIFAPLNIHGAAVVGFDGQGVTGELQDIIICQ